MKSGGELGLKLNVGVDINDANAQINKLVNDGVSALKAGNQKVVKEVENQLSALTGEKGKVEIETILNYKADTGALKFEDQIQTQILGKLSKKKQVETASLQNLKKRLSKEVQSRNNIQAIVTRTGMLGKVLKTKVNPEWNKANEKVKTLQREVNKLSQMGGTGGGPLGKVLSVGNKFSQVVSGFTAVGVAMQGVNAAVKPIVGRQKDLQALKLTLEGVGVTVSGQNAVISSASAVALKYGQSVTKIEGAYKRLTPAILEQGGTLSDTEKAIETISARTATLGLNTEQTGRYIEAFAQVMGKGKLQGEELNQQFSELDGALRGQLKAYFAANEGITDFEEAMRNGQITSGLFLEAINAISDTLREKMARDAQAAQKGIETLGEKGGLTIQQLNNQMQTLSKLGLGAIAKPLAPLGKSLARIYAAFVQIFTKIATEMPGVQKLFTVLSEVVGRVLEVGLNATLILFGKLMEALDFALQKLDEWVQAAMNLPIIGPMFKKIGEAADGAMESLRDGIDTFSELDESTTGAVGKLGEFDETVQNLKAQLDAGKITQAEYNDRINDLNTQQAQAQLSALAAKAAETAAKLKEASKAADSKVDDAKAKRDGELDTLKRIGEGLKANIDLEIAGNNRAMESISRKAEAAKNALDQVKTSIKANADAQRASIDRQSNSSKAAYSSEIASIDAATDKIRAKFSRIKAGLESQKAGVEAAYAREIAAIDRAQAAATSAHTRRMSQIDRQRDAAVGAIEDEISALEQLTPAEQALADIKRQELMATAMDPSATQKERLEAVAQLEREQRRIQIAEKQKQIKAEEAAAEKARQAEEDRHAREMEAFEERRAKAAEQQATALAGIASQMEQAAEAEKKAIEEQAQKKKKADEDEKKRQDELKQKKEEIADQEKQALQAIEQRQKQISADAKQAIADLKEENKKLEQKKKDIDQAIKDATLSEGELLTKANATTTAFGDQVGRVRDLTGELRSATTQANILLSRLRAAEQAAANASANSGPGPNAFSGGPVSGGKTYTVNELGQEGFLTPGGKLSTINAPAWGQWKAPSSGTVIPAHVFSELKASASTSPAGISPVIHNQVGGMSSMARAISGMSGGGDHIVNNMTIQAANTTQAASDMLVEMTKVRRRRYR